MLHYVHQSSHSASDRKLLSWFIDLCSVLCCIPVFYNDDGDGKLIILHEYLPTRNLRSASALLLQQPSATTVFSSRASPVATPSVWNSLNIHTRSAETFLTFKSRLKLNCSRPVTTPDFPASSQHRAPDSLAIDTRALYTFILHDITVVMTYRQRLQLRSPSTRPCDDHSTPYAYRCAAALRP